MIWKAEAPSNIALIKYMGKVDSENNIPSNASLSYTLNNLVSTVTLETSDEKTDRWEAIDSNIFELNNKSEKRFLNHLSNIKNYFNYQGNFIVRSGNNFPSDCGLASSASSYAALTKCAVDAIGADTQMNIEDMAKLSQMGSGSSCRSMFEPWALWNKDSVSQVDPPTGDLIHRVIVISNKPKEVSSNEAHQRVTSSPLFKDRPARAEKRLKDLTSAFQRNDWKKAYEITWEEFIDMHELFKTSNPSFIYMTKETLQVLKAIQDYWDTNHNGPLVTMDAGPNIHLLFKKEYEGKMNSFIEQVSNGNTMI